MTKPERDELINIRKRLEVARSRLPASATYVMGEASQGAGGAMDEAIKALNALIGSGEEGDKHDE